MHIEHVAVWSRDIERLKDFYVTYFGARAGKRYERPAEQYASYFLVFDDGARLELMQMPTIPASQNDPEKQFTGLIHLALSVGTELAVDALTERLQLDGYRVVSPPRRTGDGYYESVVFDPDDNRIEITV
jgi:lactoylglutathione lyase